MPLSIVYCHFQLSTTTSTTTTTSVSTTTSTSTSTSTTTTTSTGTTTVTVLSPCSIECDDGAFSSRNLTASVCPYNFFSLVPDRRAQQRLIVQVQGLGLVLSESGHADLTARLHYMSTVTL
ncbi:hypothetical protein E2C01_083188 [Portunus trituberculatus]|uniref:Uncharacterized protein n=1 Tax=Portunus trituberculatus TaxID=210409 RepID=A0A5B7J3U6_PORTR|nr:hypothetical protein [Portunus trituberculatus]